MDLLQDARYAARKLLRSPGFTVVAIATLTLAIGSTTAVFSIVNGVLLKPLPYRDPAQLAIVSSQARDGSAFPLSGRDFIDYRDQSKSFVGMAALDNSSMNLTGTDAEPLRLNVADVGARFFELLGIRAQLGRTFAADEDRQGAPRVAILSQGLWQGRFGRDPRIIGRQITLDGKSYTVVGVAPATLEYPRKPDVWIPFVFPDWMLDPANRGAHSFVALARLKPGIPAVTAATEIGAIARRLEQEYPNTNTKVGGTVQPLQQYVVGDVAPALYAILGAVGFVLLIACANIANLLLVRAAARESEIAVRTALGAGRGRLVRQLVTESVLLAGIGAVLGTALAAWAVDAVVAFGPRGLPRLSEVSIDHTVLAFTALVALGTGLLFGLLPALHAARPDISQMLRENVRGSSRGGGNASRTRSLLVVTEMAMAVVLLVGAGLLIRSFARLVHVDPGFSTEHVVAFSVTIPDSKYPFDRDKRAFATQLTDRLRALPGSADAGVILGLPMQPGGSMRTSFEVAGQPPNQPDRRTITEVHPASPGYFGTMGIRLLKGRLFTEAETRPGMPPVLVVTEEFVRRYFPNESPIGKTITLGISHDTAAVGAGSVDSKGEIVGIVHDVKQSGLARDLYPTVYLPYGLLPFNDLSAVVRSSADPRLVEGAIRTAVHDIDPGLPIFGLTTMEQAVSSSVAQPRFYMILLTSFAVVALLLAAIGIYGVISYAVSLRTRELGIRIALGATRDRVVRQVLGQGLWLTGIGVLVGLGAALWLARLIASLLFGIGTFDPLTFTAVAVTLGAVAILASWLPARRAAEVDPVIAMRAE
ncbi:MAG TPA: ABC transporter permease [Gemmatimonadaceae bacterium]|nr:ABC transporter permease [Gemmatimonadaceae bacterium]